MSNPTQEPWYARLPWLIPWAIIVGLLYLSIQLSPTPVSFRAFTFDEIIQFLTGLALIALFMERALEVFVTTWRGPGATDLDNKLADAEKQLDTLTASVAALSEVERDRKQGEIAHASEHVQAAQSEKTKFKSRTQRLALWTSLILGAAISLVGVRSLEPLVNADTFGTLNDFQRAAFHVVDVLLTGGLIAGGSDGIHKITAVFTEFFEKTRSNIKNG
jgi:hypothetical protein